MSQLAHNKACEIEDFADPDLLATIQAIFQHEARSYAPDFPSGVESPRYWEAAMAVRALRDLGALRPDATLLVVGAGAGPTPFYLTNYARQVFAIDRYFEPGAASMITPRMFLLEPEELAPYPFDLRRLVVQHMDERQLRFPDAHFDGILAFNLIGKVGNLDEVAHACYELGRVLKPGGVLAICTPYRLGNPPGGVGYNETPIPSFADIQRYIVEASGLEPVDELDDEISQTTLDSRRDLTSYAELNGSTAGALKLGSGTDWESWSHQPYLIHIHHGFIFSSLHLALQKTAAYPAWPNTWAQPGPEVAEAIRRASQVLLATPSAPSGSRQKPSIATTETVIMQRSSETMEQARSHFRTWDEARIRGWYNRTLRRLPRPLGALGRSLIRVGNLGKVHEAQAQLSLTMIEHHSQIDQRLDETGGRIGELEVRSDEQSDQIASVWDQTRQAQQLTTSLTALNGRVGQLERQLEQEVGRQTAQLTQQIAGVEALLAELRAAQQQLAERLDAHSAGQQQLAERLDTSQQQLAERLDTSQQQLAERLDTSQQLAEQWSSERQALDLRVRQAISMTRLIQQRLDVEHAGGAPPAEAIALAPAEALELIAELERASPDLAACTAVELSVAGAQAEQLVAVLAEYFGERTSSRESSYRYPNDAWYHIDFSAAWNRPSLFANAISRLGEAGYFVLVTVPEHDTPGAIAGLQQVEERTFELAGGRAIRSYVWRKAAG
jgi:SAM-dependent methyltransferase